MTASDIELLKAKLNLETSMIGWGELQRFFAAGSIIVVREDLDLVEAATGISADDGEQVKAWLEHGKISKISDSQALAWFQANASLWAVVVKPWVLVQPPKPERLQ